MKWVDDRKVLSGIIPVIQKGLHWVDAPPAAYCPHKTLYNRCRRWSGKGVFDLIFSELSASDSAESPDAAEPPDAPEPEVLMIDATDIKAYPTACSLNKEGTPRLIGGTKGGTTSKLHVICDSKGGPLRLHLSEGQCSDFTGADVVIKDLPPAATVMGYQGYDRDKIRKMLSQQGITPCIPPRRCWLSRS